MFIGHILRYLTKELNTTVQISGPGDYLKIYLRNRQGLRDLSASIDWARVGLGSILSYMHAAPMEFAKTTDDCVTVNPSLI